MCHLDRGEAGADVIVDDGRGDLEGDDVLDVWNADQPTIALSASFAAAIVWSMSASV